MKNTSADSFYFWCFLIIFIYIFIIKPLRWLLNKALESDD